MGWETSLLTHIRFHKQTYNSLYEVENAYEEADKMVKYMESKLQNLAMMTEPKKFCDEEDDPMSFIQCECSNCLEELEIALIDRYKLGLLIDSWKKCHNEEGLAIPDPEGIDWEDSFLEGDFVKTTKNKDDFA